MARTFRGNSEVSRAMAVLEKAESVEQLRQAQAVLLPLQFGMSLSDTARVLGISTSWTSRLRNRFINGQIVRTEPVERRGGVRRSILARDQEAALLRSLSSVELDMPLCVSVPKLKQALEQARGRSVALSTVYNVLLRHGVKPRNGG